MISGDLRGSGGLTVNNGFNWTGGTINSTGVLNLPATCTTTLDQGGNFAGNSGIINNSGTFNMAAGTLGQLTAPARFNNLPGGVLELNGWANPSGSWVQNIFNQGTINKNNGTVQFDLPFPMTNEAEGILNVNSGTLRFSAFATLRGTVNVPTGSAIIGTPNGVGAEGLTVLNDGSITPLITFQGTAPHFLNGTGSLVNLSMNGTGLVTLGGTQTMSGTLSFTTGVIDLGENDLVLTNAAVGAVSGGSASSHVRTSSSGTLKRTVNGNNYVFPVGASSYNPLTISLASGPQEQFAVRVQDGVHREYGAPGIPAGSLLTSDVVDRTWVVSEEVAGGNTANITLQWNAADELIGFSRSTCAVANYSDPDWVPGAFGPAIGNGPFTRTITGLGAFRELCVADAEAPLNDIGTGMVAVDGIALHAYPNPASTVLYIQGMELQEAPSNAVLIDATGRRVAIPFAMQGNVATIDVSSMTNGLYILELTDQQRHFGQLRVVIAH
jgi:hypothetical protein